MNTITVIMDNIWEIESRVHRIIIKILILILIIVIFINRIAYINHDLFLYFSVCNFNNCRITTISWNILLLIYLKYHFI